MKNLIMPLSFLLLLVGCTDDKWRETWVLENLLDEEVKITVLRTSYRASLDSRGFAPVSYRLPSKQSKVLLSYSVTAQDPQISALTAFHSFFTEAISTDSMIIEFNDGKLLHFTVPEEEPLDPLNPYNSNSTTSAWTTTELEEDVYEVRFKIGRQHKEAAN
ncbi:hypothetical protein [Roseivirga pacifica]|uniref:hypothetical protein n=1 Tax=Roseivirga pacifica TaxID=1267423 RepID=UPI0020951F6B|nr:hypothetical protein [Roseivirga pacifica]MCO6358971.1 hypothetical protein [Roseivirga pacifica]MCO6365393.1 hypothetical protein [Roseivirga pacifica]MCO6371877.1 hypothetical protein [Roseivirga pacifica]MCO6376012.1 hypothetical protein [Roseivirga pacifica]MCO6379255.1 hypothetical protein [Roseivirga pacifica]